MNKTFDKISWAGIAIIAVGVIVSSWIRLNYGVETSDEVFWISEAHIVASGAIPFTNNWNQTPGTVLLYFPLVKLFEFIMGSTVGIVLFIRRAFFIYKLLISTAIIFLIRKHTGLKPAIVFVLPFLTLGIFNIDNFNYNTLSNSLLALTGFVVFSLLNLDSPKKQAILAALSGVLAALTALSHLSQILNCVVIGIVFACYEKVLFKRIRLFGLYVAGGLATALLVFIGISIASGGPGYMFEGISNVLKLPYFNIKHAAISNNFVWIFNIAKHYVKYFLGICVVVFLLVLFVNYGAKKILKSSKLDISFRAIYSSSIAVGSIIYLAFICFSGNYTANEILMLSCTTFFSVPLLLLIAIKTHRKQCVQLLAFIYLPSFVTFLTLILGINSYTGLGRRWYVFAWGAMLSVLFCYYALEETIGGMKKNIVIEKEPAGIPSRMGAVLLCVPITLSIVLSFALATAFQIAHYLYVYRDAPINQLTYKMESGIYRGLYTLEARGEELIDLEQQIKRVTSAEDQILFMDVSPYAYLMTEGKALTPSTWTPNLYDYGFTGTDCLYDYFEFVQKEPTKIIYISRENTLLTIFTDDCEFNDYVNSNYTLTYQNNALQFAMYVYEQNLS